MNVIGARLDMQADVTINAKLAGNPNAPQFPIDQFTSVIRVMGRA